MSRVWACCYSTCYTYRSVGQYSCSTVLYAARLTHITAHSQLCHSLAGEFLRPDSAVGPGAWPGHRGSQQPAVSGLRVCSFHSLIANNIRRPGPPRLFRNPKHPAPPPAGAPHPRRGTPWAFVRPSPGLGGPDAQRALSSRRGSRGSAVSSIGTAGGTNSTCILPRKSPRRGRAAQPGA